MTRKPKIVFYIHALAGGGAERVWSVLANGFAARDYEVVFAVDYEADHNRGYLGTDVRLVVLGGNHWQTILRLRRLLRAETPDIVISALAASNLKLTVAGLISGYLDRTVLSYHGYAESEPQALSAVSFRLSAVLTRLAARTICVSEGLQDYLCSHWAASRSNSQRIYNPVLVQGADIPPDAAGLARRAPIVLAVGRLTSYKNLISLVRAFAAVDDASARLVMLGDGPERAALSAEIMRLGLQGRVEMPGYVAEPWPYFQEARCFVLPSRSESFGLVLVEAMAHGLEVIATECDGPREILARGEFGTLVPHDDVPALTKSIANALAHPSDPTARIGRAAQFGVDAALDQYEAMFRSVMARATSPITAVEPRQPRRNPVALISAQAQKDCPVTALPTISIVVTNYNYAGFLPQCLDSVMAQTYPDIECIVVDDGSTDDSRSVIARYPSMKTVFQSNTGHAIAARNGLKAATGQIVVFLDSDDFLFPDACAEIARQWADDLVAVHYRLQIYKDGAFQYRFWPEGPFPSEDRANRVLGFGTIPFAPTSGNAYARSYCDLIFREGTGLTFNSIDSTLAFSAPIVGKTVVCERALGAYRMHGNNVTMWDRRRPISSARMGLFYGYHAQKTARKLAAAQHLPVPAWDFLNGAYELKLYLTIRGAAMVDALDMPKRAPLACANQAARVFLRIPGLSLATRAANVALVYLLAAAPFSMRRMIGERFYNLDFAN